MKEITTKGTISSITSHLDNAASGFKATWFRGQPSYSHKLLPSIFRQGNNFGVSLNEQRMLNEFKRRYPDQSSNHKTTYEWLTLMQHYGLPTRLLDWSSNLLVALYFCCISEENCDGALYVFDPTYMERDYRFNELLEMQVQEKTRADFFNRLVHRLPDIINDESRINDVRVGDIKEDITVQVQFFGLSTGSMADFSSLTIQQRLVNVNDHNGNPVSYVEQDIIRAFSNIVPFRAPHLNPRIRQQHGLFTFHGGMFIDGEEFIKVEDMEQDHYAGDSLLKIKVLAKDKSTLLKELEYVGIREATLFPEMEYQAKEIKNQFSIYHSQ
ncbi:MAG: FRG domain-containing protein [Alphaproteobacteria bacterium]